MEKQKGHTTELQKIYCAVGPTQSTTLLGFRISCERAHLTLGAIASESQCGRSPTHPSAPSHTFRVLFCFFLKYNNICFFKVYFI